jgi:hypothetical protein
MIRALALSSCATCLLLSHAAWSKPKVALTQIEGDATGDVRDAVAEAIEGSEISLIASREVNRAVDKLGDLSDLTEKDFKKLASELEADAIVAGKLDRVGKARTIKFRLFVHRKMAKGFTVSFKDPKSEKFRAALHDKMLDKLGAAGAGAGDAEDARPAKGKAEADDEPVAAAEKKGQKGGKPKKGKKAKAEPADDAEEAVPAKKGRLARADDAEDARPTRKKPAEDSEDALPPRKKALADDDAAPRKKAAEPESEDALPPRKARPEAKADDAGDDARAAADGDDAPRKAKKRVASADDEAEVEASAAPVAEAARGAGRAALRLDVGGSVTQRSLKFNTIQFANAPHNLALSPVPGARFAGEIYPLLLNGSHGVLANLGLGFDYDKTFGLHLSAVDSATKMTFDVPVKQSHFGIGLRYRQAFGKTDSGPTLTLGVGYRKSLFSPDRSALTANASVDADVRRDAPGTNYTMIDPGATFRLPVTRMVAFSLGGKFLVVTDAGPIQGPRSYGQAKVYGFQAAAGVDVVLGRHLALQFSGEFTQVGYSFVGGSDLSSGLDGDTSKKEVGGLSDRAIGGAATVAVMY